VSGDWVVVFGARGDPQVQRVTRAVREQKGRVFLCDSAAFPGTVRVAFSNDRMRVNGKPLPEAIRSAYLRSLGPSYRVPEFADDLAARPHGLLAQLDECGAMMTSIVSALRTQGVPLVNELDVNAQHGRKPYQLRLLQSAGLPIPRFLASNDPKAVRSFVRRVKRAVYKPMAGGATVREVEPEDLASDRLDALANAPVLFQELVDGTSVRIYVVGKKAVAAGEILSTELRGSDSDSGGVRGVGVQPLAHVCRVRREDRPGHRGSAGQIPPVTRDMTTDPPAVSLTTCVEVLLHWPCATPVLQCGKSRSWTDHEDYIRHSRLQRT